MKTKNAYAWITPALVFLLCPILAAAEISVGVATPQKENITINKFPFHYKDSFRIYNNGDKERIYTIDILAPYNDILGWVNTNTSIFVLGPDTSTQIRFIIDAEEGYTGNYTIIFRPAAIPEFTEQPSLQNQTKIIAYAKLSSVFKFRIEVPDVVGEGSLGQRSFLEDKTLKEKRENITKIVTDTTKDARGVEFMSLTKPTVLNLPETVYVGELTKIGLSVIGGNVPVGLSLLIVSPTGRRYIEPPSTEFRFDENGKWGVLVTIAGKVIFGKVVEVKAKPEGGINTRTLIMAAEILAIVALLVVILIVRRSRKKKHHHVY